MAEGSGDEGKTYYELFKLGSEEGRVKEISYNIIKWEEPDQSVCGEVIGFEDFEEGAFEGKCLAWKIDTDQGLVSCVCGSVADERMKNVAVGDLISITFQGKKDIAEGRRMNMFQIKHIPAKV